MSNETDDLAEDQAEVAARGRLASIHAPWRLTCLVSGMALVAGASITNQNPFNLSAWVPGMALLILASIASIWCVAFVAGLRPVYIFRDANGAPHVETAPPVLSPLGDSRSPDSMPKGIILSWSRWSSTGKISHQAERSWESISVESADPLRFVVRDRAGYSIGGLELWDAFTLMERFPRVAYRAEQSGPSVRALLNVVEALHPMKQLPFFDRFAQELQQYAVDARRIHDLEKQSEDELDRWRAVTSHVQSLTKLVCTIRAAKPKGRGARAVPADIALYNRPEQIAGFLDIALCNLGNHIPGIADDVREARGAARKELDTLCAPESKTTAA